MRDAVVYRENKKSKQIDEIDRQIPTETIERERIRKR